MHPDLPPLLALQEIDQQIARLRLEIAQLPLARRRVEAVLADAKRKLLEAKQAQQSTELLRRQKEGEIEELGRRLARYQAQQMQVRKNEEYQALSHEILQVKSEVEREEEEVLLLLERGDALKIDVKQEEEKARQAEEEARQQRKALAEKESRLRDQLADAEKDRERRATAVNQALLARYQNLVRGHRENAVVPVVYGNCGGCHMKLTRQTLLRAEVGAEFAFCDNCGRILFVAG